MTSTGGSAAATLQQPQPPPQPPSQLSPPPQTQTHVPTATTDTMAVDAPRSEHKAPPSTRTHLDSYSPRRKHHHSRRSRTQRRRGRVMHSHSSTRRHRRQHRRRSSTPPRRLSKHQPVRPHKSGRRPPSSRRSRSARALPTNSACQVEKQISTRPRNTHTTCREQMAVAPIRHFSSDKAQTPATSLNRAAFCTVSSHGQTSDTADPSQLGLWICYQQTTTYPTTKTPHIHTTTTHSHTTATHTSQHHRDEEEAEQSAQPIQMHHQHHDIPASRILPPSHKQAPVSQQRFWRAIVPKPFCQLRDTEKPRPLPYEVAAANQFAQTLAELAEGSGISMDHIQAFSRMIHEAGLQDRTEVPRTTVLDIGQGVYKVVFIPIDLGTPPLAFGQHPDEARGSVWSYVAAHVIVLHRTLKRLCMQTMVNMCFHMHGKTY